ncbi:MAG: polyprenyl synthetase family protein, partial [Opitutae bacterium]|nr:polyprenyl synthetase family protein [Opitutae bacterium]
DLATGKLTLPLMLLLEKLPPAERAELADSLREGRPLGLAAKVERMRELGIADGVIAAIDRELAQAAAALAPFAALTPTPLMLALGGVLQGQVAALRNR